MLLQCSRKRTLFLRNCAESNICMGWEGQPWFIPELPYHCFLCRLFFLTFFSFLVYQSSILYYSIFPCQYFFIYTACYYSLSPPRIMSENLRCFYQGPTILAEIEQFLSSQNHETRNLLTFLDSQMLLLGFLASPLALDIGIAVPKGKHWAPFSAVFSSPGSWPSVPPYLW